MEPNIWGEILKEVWKTIPEYNSYQVSNLGRVVSAGRVVNSIQGSRRTQVGCSIMRSTDNGKGYKLVTISIGRKRKNFYIHRLVARAFLPNPSNKTEVNHINGNKSDNRLSNLEWVTTEENRTHAKRTGLVCSGERVGGSKLTSKQIVEIVEYVKANPSANRSALGRKYGIRDTTILKILNGQRWKSITCGVYDLHNNPLKVK